MVILASLLLSAPEPRQLNAAVTEPTVDTMVAALSVKLGALNLVQCPVWVVDIDQRRVPWANQAGLAIWQAQNLSALAELDLKTRVTDDVTAQLQRYQVGHAISRNPLSRNDFRVNADGQFPRDQIQ